MDLRLRASSIDPPEQANGLQAYFASLLLFFLLQQHGPAYGLEVSWVYHHMGELLSAMNLFSLAFCGFLLAKGLTRPSTTDSGSSGNWIIDFYWCVQFGERAGERVKTRPSIDESTNGINRPTD